MDDSRNQTRRCLMVAFHFPPCNSSSGYLRTEKFVKYLPRFGWKPHVLTAQVRAYGTLGQDSSVADNITRSFALDAQRHLSIGGKYPGFLALPDRWISWLPAAVIAGFRLLRQPNMQVIWSTYPIATAHLIGYCLKRLSKKPWVADFRDPMIDDVHPVGKSKRWAFRKIEALVFKHADLVCCTTPSAVDLYQQRYPERDRDSIACIGNGYDAEDFADLDFAGKQAALESGRPLVLVHSGTLYPLERDPVPFLHALRALKQAGKASASNLQVILRATGHDEFCSDLLEKLQLGDIVTLAPGLEYKAALQEMVAADGLLVFQAANCNAQVPAKVYEYLRAGQPIFAMTDDEGDTAAVLVAAGVEFVVALDDSEAIASRLKQFIEGLQFDTIKPANPGSIQTLSREHSARLLASKLDELMGAGDSGVEASSE